MNARCIKTGCWLYLPQEYRLIMAGDLFEFNGGYIFNATLWQDGSLPEKHAVMRVPEEPTLEYLGEYFERKGVFVLLDDNRAFYNKALAEYLRKDYLNAPR